MKRPRSARQAKLGRWGRSAHCSSLLRCAFDVTFERDAQG